ncbi:MAG: S49 family peptidase [Bacteroidales bacterium]
MYARLLEFLSARWLIHRDEVLSYLPVMVSFINGNKLAIEDFADDKTRNKPYILTPYILKKSQGPNMVTEYELNDLSIPENSIAVIPIIGVIYSYKTQNLVNSIIEAENNPNISAILFVVNSPGGMVFYTDIAADVIKNTQKPTVAYVLNMAASAAMWLISAMDERIVSSRLDMVGSIGVMTTFMDMTGLLKEKLGITIYELYASKSTRKNNHIRELLKGNDKPILDDLDFTNEVFHQVIRENLGIKEDSEVFTGEIYNAEKAISLGLADRIGTFEQAIDSAYKKGLVHSIKSLNNNF